MNYRENDSGLQILEIEVTNRCNLNCKHCYVDKGKIADLPQKLVQSVITQSNELGINRMVFTGGEPLLYPGLFDLAGFARSIGVPEVALLTNGLLINEKTIDELKIFSEIQLSVDVPPKRKGVLREEYASRLAEKIDILKGNGLNVTIFATLSKGILPFIDELVNFSRAKNLNLGLNRLFPIRPELKAECLSPTELKQVLTKISSFNIDARIGCSDPLLFLVDKKRMQYYSSLVKPGIKGGCIAGIAAMYITSLGEVYPCPFLQVTSGNIFNKTLKDIWENSEYFHALRDRFKIEGYCHECEYVDYCGGCRAASFINYGNIFGSDPNCFKNL